MSMTVEMVEFVQLWNLVQNVHFTDRPDKISWRWTLDGEYSVKSTVQFQGSFCSFEATSIWKARVEGKHRFSAWLLVQNKILTADKLAARN